MKKKRKILIFILILLVFIGIGYCVFVFSENTFIRKWRNIYIETAMTTNSHQWLATYFIPNNIINEVLEDRTRQEELQKDLESTWGNIEDSEIEEVEPISGLQNITDTINRELNNKIPQEYSSQMSETYESPKESTINNIETKETIKTQQETFYENYWELDTSSFKEYIEELDIEDNDYETLVIDDLDYKLGIKTTNGDKLLALDVPNNTMIIGVSGDGFVGKLAIIKDISQVSVESSSSLGTKGELAKDFSERYDAELVVNASGFKDVGGHGSGGIVKGSYVLNGKEIGSPMNKHWKFVGVKDDGRLYISTREKTDISSYRWGVEFYPALIVDGENVVDGSYCMGIQPRTTIGQSASGDFLILVVDGRQVGYSLGCTVADCRDILFEYKAVQAMNLDGGSSSVLYYKGELINKPSSGGGIGRYMPNAIIVNKKDNLGDNFSE